jgi:hypothetical protein
MNARTLKKMLDDYGFETERVLDCVLDVFIRQNVSDKGVLAEDVSRFTGVLQSYRLLKRKSWGKVELFTCTAEGEKIAQELLERKVAPVFEKMSQLDLKGSYFVLKYTLYLVNQGKNQPSQRPELKLLASLPVVQNVQSALKQLLLDHGVCRRAHRVTASGPGEEVTVTVPDLYTYFELYYTKEESIPVFEQTLKRISRKLNLFRVLYSYDQRTERLYLRKLREYNFSLEDMSGILVAMKEEGMISYSYDPVLFRVEDKETYRKFLREHLLSQILDEFSQVMHQGVTTNPQAYRLLAEFEEEFRTFLEETLKKGQGVWEHRIPPDILSRLQERQNDARIKKKTVYPLLHYIDFPNYLSIILHRTDAFSNWELFEPYFLSIGWIKGRLIEMNEIRNDLAHPKPLESLQYRKLQLYIDEIRARMR